MAVIDSTLDTQSEEYQQNRDALLAAIEEFRAIEQKVVDTAESKRPKFDKRGQLLPIERVSRLLDAGSPFLSLMNLAGYKMHDDKDGTEAGGGVIGLCRTSNPGGDDLQMLDTGGEPLFVRVAEMIAQRWSRLGDCGLVVGATYPNELSRVRQIVGDLPILVPGVGAQGGSADEVKANGSRSDGHGIIVNSSRAVLYASTSDDFASAARLVADDTRKSCSP